MKCDNDNNDNTTPEGYKKWNDIIHEIVFGSTWAEALSQGSTKDGISLDTTHFKGSF